MAQLTQLVECSTFNRLAASSSLALGLASPPSLKVVLWEGTFFWRRVATSEKETKVQYNGPCSSVVEPCSSRAEVVGSSPTSGNETFRDSCR